MIMCLATMQGLIMLPPKQKKEAKEFFSGTCYSSFILTFGNKSNRMMKAVN